MEVNLRKCSVLSHRQLVFFIIVTYFRRVCSIGAIPPTAVGDATVVIKNAFIQNCFAYEVKIYAFHDALSHTGLDDVEFELCDGDLPKGAVIKDIGFDVGTKGRVLCLPNGKRCYEKENGRTGVYRATLTANSETEKFIAIVNPDTDLIPVSPVTQTISQGETTDLEVDYISPHELVWTYDGPSKPNKWKGELKITVDQPGIYQVFSKKARNERLTFRVIKRACSDGMYGANCDMTCNSNCGDGAGVCDDEDGSCICTPGFRGADCSTVDPVPFGFGVDGTLFCEGNGVANPGCKGIMFCRRDPFGCSCMRGFGGPRCTEECPTGMFGPNCEFGSAMMK